MRLVNAEPRIEVSRGLEASAAEKSCREKRRDSRERREADDTTALRDYSAQLAGKQSHKNSKMILTDSHQENSHESYVERLVKRRGSLAGDARCDRVTRAAPSLSRRRPRPSPRLGLGCPDPSGHARVPPARRRARPSCRPPPRLAASSCWTARTRPKTTSPARGRARTSCPAATA